MASEEQARRAKELLEAAIEGFLSGDEKWAGAGSLTEVPEAMRAPVERLCDSEGAYRDAALTLLAFPAANGVPWNVTDRFERDRSTSNWLGRFLRSRDIPAVASALQNSSFRHGFTHERIRSEELRTVLLWANEPDRAVDEVRSVVFRIARRRAEAARAVTQLPTVFAPELTFERTLAVYEELLLQPSGGAAEQYAFAGLLQAYVEAVDDRARVESKDINAADAGRVAGDVQVIRGQAEIVDAYEVSAADWATKLDQAVSMIRHHGLARAHIVAVGSKPVADYIRMELESRLPSGLAGGTADISVLDLESEIRSLIARLTKSGRKRAIVHTWQWLARYSPELTDRLVGAVVGLGVSEA